MSVSTVQRYYASLYGRFNTADQYQASAAPSDPGTWNRYAYVRGDPINRRDPNGTCYGSTALGFQWDDEDAEALMYFGALNSGELWHSYGFCVTGVVAGGPNPCDILGAGANALLQASVNCTAPVTYAAYPSEPQQPQPTCELSLQYRGLDFPVVGLLAGHSYMHFTSSDGTDEVIEGYDNGSGSLKAWEDPHGLDADNKSTDKKFGDISGSFVCDWLSSLLSGVNNIDNAGITYDKFGPNSNSTVAYLLRQLPNVASASPWVGSVPLGLFGWNTPLPGLK